jgi:peptidoglycan biosynthesis protein MviN/MurJ (putative lipid II flippase)
MEREITVITRGTAIMSIGILLGIPSVLAIFAFPIWALVIAFGMAEDVHSTASMINAIIAAPYVALVALWALFLSMIWATKPIDENGPSPPPR